MAIHRCSPALWRYGRTAFALSAILAFAACAAQEQPDNKVICSAYAGQLTNGEVVADGTVGGVLGERRGPSGEHEGFLLQLDGDCDLLLRVETNTDITGPIPLHRGERVIVKGVYVYTPLGGVIHWTHHDPGGRHEAGFVKTPDGKLYQ
jgi:hypothetical protein